jgi:hypothetical protein
VTSQDIRDLVSLAGEARAQLPAGQPVSSASLVDVLRQRARRPVLSDFLDRGLWWMLFLNSRDHERAMLLWPEDAGQLYDHEQSPGFRASMLHAYDRILDPPSRQFEQLNSDSYKNLLDLVTSGLDERLSWTGEPDPGSVAYRLYAERMAEDMLTEYVAGRPLVARLAVQPDPPTAGNGSSQEGPREALALTALRPFAPGSSRLLVVTRYRQDKAPGLAGAALEDYYEQIGAAHDDTARLTAIARLTRRLHVMHLFTGANGRLNVYLLLPRLLLENGFRPVIHPEMHAMFNGGWSLDEIVAALGAAQPRGVPAAEDPSGRIPPPPDPRIDLARRVIELLPGLGWAAAVPAEARILDLFQRLSRERIYMGRTTADIAGYVARVLTGPRVR